MILTIDLLRIQDSDLDARGVLDIQPDLSTLRVLPYAKKTALIIGTAHDQYSGELSEFCPRGLSSRVLQTAEKDHKDKFNFQNGYDSDDSRVSFWSDEE